MGPLGPCEWNPVRGGLRPPGRLPTEAAHETVELDATRPRALLIPPGVAHGYQALTDARLLYLVTNEYDGTDEQGLRFDDPALGFAWPVPAGVVSDRDRTAPTAADVVRPSFGGDAAFGRSAG